MLLLFCAHACIGLRRPARDIEREGRVVRYGGEELVGQLVGWLRPFFRDARGGRAFFAGYIYIWTRPDAMGFFRGGEQRWTVAGDAGTKKNTYTRIRLRARGGVRDRRGAGWWTRSSVVGWDFLRL